MTATVENALALHRAGRLAEAEQAYRQAIENSSSAIPAQKGLGVVLLQLDRAAEALEVFRKITDSGAKDADTFNNLGAAALQCGHLDEAQSAFTRAVEQDGSHGQAWANLGVVLFRQNVLDESAAAFEKAVSVDPNNADTHYNHSRTLRALGRLNEAEQAARQALALTPDHVDARVNLGVTQAAKGDRKAAEASYREALNANPQAAAAHHNLAQILLQTGRLKEGWDAFEWRWQTPDFQGADDFLALPPWQGEALEDDTLLVWTEQGVGDQILYGSMIADLESQAPNILVACTERLVPLFARSFPFAQVMSLSGLKADQDTLESVTAQVPAGSLGRFLRPGLEAFPSRAKYLAAESRAVETKRDAYAGHFGAATKIGLSWRSGNPRFGAAKSMALMDLAPLFDLPNTAFVDLQYGDTADERETLAQTSGHTLFRDLEIDSLASLDDFATQVASLDLVITASNTTAHVAGALGVPCWVLLPTGPGLLWYWFLDRSDSPWYPSLRLFRQASPSDWTPVVQDVGEALDQVVQTHSGSS